MANENILACFYSIKLGGSYAVPYIRPLQCTYNVYRLRGYLVKKLRNDLKTHRHAAPDLPFTRCFYEMIFRLWLISQMWEEEKSWEKSTWIFNESHILCKLNLYNGQLVACRPSTSTYLTQFLLCLKVHFEGASDIQISSIG